MITCSKMNCLGFIDCEKSLSHANWLSDQTALFPDMAQISQPWRFVLIECINFEWQNFFTNITGLSASYFTIVEMIATLQESRQIHVVVGVLQSICPQQSDRICNVSQY